MDDDVGARDYDGVKEGVLVEGLHDWIYLSWIHTGFEFNNHTPIRPVAEAQQLTLRMIRERLDEGLFILGVPDKKAASGFKPWDLPPRRSDGHDRAQVRDEFRGSLELGHVRLAGPH